MYFCFISYEKTPDQVRIGSLGKFKRRSALIKVYWKGEVITDISSRMFKIRRIVMSMFQCILSSQLLPLYLPELVSMNAFRNNQTNTFSCKHLNNFYFLCFLITCDKQTFLYSDKVWFTLKKTTQIFSLFSIRMTQILMLKPRPMNLYVKGNSHIHRDIQKSC